MAIGRITYNGGSGVKGASETPYTIHADSEEIKAGNFVEKVGVEAIQLGTAQDIVLSTTTAQTTSTVEPRANRLLMALCEQNLCRFRLYDITQSTVPVLLDEYIFAENVVSIDMVKLKDNLIAVACDIGATSANAFAISTTNDKITKGASTAVIGQTNLTIKIAMLNASRFIVYGRKSNSNLHAISYSVGQDLSLSSASQSELYYAVPDDYMSFKNVVSNKVIGVTNSSDLAGGVEVSIFTYVDSSRKISKAGNVMIDSDGGYPNDVKVISSTKALVVYKSNANTLNAGIITMTASATSGTLQLANSSTLSTNIGSIKSIKIAEYESGKYMIIYDGKANLLNISGDTVTMEESQSASSMGENVTVVTPMNNRVTVLYRNANNYPTLTQVSVKESVVSNEVPYIGFRYEITKAKSKIDGVAKKGGKAGEQIMVYTLGGDA